MKKTFGVILGALLVLGGIMAILSALGVGGIEFSTDGWWTLFIIVPALRGLFVDKDKTGSLIFLALGVWLLLGARDIIEYSLALELIVPAVIVIVGVKIIGKAFKSDEQPLEKCDEIGREESCNTDGTKVMAVFGGASYNLTDADFEKGERRLDLMCFCGGAEIIVPANVEVKINSVCVFGGINDKRKPNADIEKTARLNINGFCILGGAEIKESK